MKGLLFLATALSLLGRLAWSAPNNATQALETWIKNPASAESLEVGDDGSPDFPILSTLKALALEKKGETQKAIEVLERVLVHVKYDPIKQSRSFYLGPRGSFALWRETLYLALARNYYKLGDYENAIYFFKGVPETSIYAHEALLGLSWSELNLEDYVNSEKTLESLASQGDRLTALQRNELQVQQSFLQLKKGSVEEAIRLGLLFRGSSDSELGTVQNKILAQSYFELYLQKSTSGSTAEKKQLLAKVIQLNNRIPVGARDPKASFFAGEVYWHYASVLRTEDPDKNAKAVQSYLRMSDQWIAPWVQKSIAANKAFLVEDAWFFSIALLWEQDRFSEAIPRLVQAERLYPQGEYRQDAFQLLADYYYETGKFDDSVNYFRKLARVGTPEKAAYGVYKAAWSFYNKEDKWAALRHFERLLFFYQEELQDKKEIPPGSLAKETRKDMLVVLGELMSTPEALNELKIFGFGGSEWLKIQDELAAVYKGIGRYEESVALWKSLLARNPKTEGTFDWLKGILEAELALGQRNQIGELLQNYARYLPSEAEHPEKHKEFQKSVVKVTLAMHKEGRKTEDPEIWKATDQVYATLLKLYPNHQQGDIWFYGAQRKESLGQKLAAMEWYQKAALVAGYENTGDAGLSVLRIAKDLADKENNAQKRDPKVYQTIVAVAKWYIDTFQKTQQRGLAEFLILEGYTYLGQYAEAEAYLAKTFGVEGATKEHQNQYFEHNRRFYKNKSWQQAYQSAHSVAAQLRITTGVKDPEFLGKVVRIEQESAFQAGFAVEKADSKQAREWYHKAVLAKGDPAVRLKAWNNLFSTFKLPAERAEFFDAFGEFESGIDIEIAKDYNLKKLVFNIFAKAVENAEKSFLIQEKTDLVLQASKWAEPKDAPQLRWDAAVLAGSYYNSSQMNLILKAMEKQDRAFLYDPTRMLTLARLSFWNGDLTTSWQRLQWVVKQKNVPPASWVLVRDLFVATQTQSPEVEQQMKGYLIDHHSSLKNEALLQPIWATLMYPDFGANQVAQWETAGLQAISGAKRTLAGGSAQAQLKGRLDEVAFTLKDLDKAQTEIREYIDSPAPQVTVEAICIVPRFREQAIGRLKRLKEPVVKSTQWPAFLARLDQKIQELEKTYQKEVAICDQQKRIIAYMPPIQKVASALCNGAQCFPSKPSDLVAAVALRRQNPKSLADKLALVTGLLQQGAWGIAEEYVYSLNVQQEKELLLGYLRLAMGDSWNAYPLLNAATKLPEAAPHAKLFLSRILWRNGHRGLASRESQGLQPAVLTEWEKDLLIELQTDLRRK